VRFQPASTLGSRARRSAHGHFAKPILTHARRAMIEAVKYSAVESLRDGRHCEIRALRPDDRAQLTAAVGRIGTRSLYRRFFTVKRRFTEREVAFFVDVDFVKHVALVAVVEESGRAAIVGGGRYVVGQPGKAEVAFAVID
jgi:hypothetical protein